MAEPALYIAFIAGLASFLSPCVLPLIPGFLAYLAGATPKKGSRLLIFLNSVAFVLGFSAAFAIIGLLLSTIFQNVAESVQAWLSRIAGVIIILFGLYVLGYIKLGFLENEHRFHAKKFRITYITSFLFGAAFAIGWTPCVGPILGTVLTMAIVKPALSFMLLLAYSLGLGIPFLLVGLFGSHAIALINKSSRFLKYFNLIVGILLVILGTLIFTGELNTVANLFF